MNYYNDNDLKVCAWLRELIAQGHLPPGIVDCRSITDVKPNELAQYDQCHFFAGIGGWPLALRWAGLEGVAGIWTGSCPCQPLSCAGKRQGHADERHLWPAFHALIAERRPATVFGEQVASKDGREWFAGVRLDLEDMGYACGGADLCAAGVGAPHRRQRLFWVADASGKGLARLRQSGSGGQAGQTAGRGKTRCMADAGLFGLQHKTERQGGNDDGRGDAVRPGNSESGGCGVQWDKAQPWGGGHVDRASGARIGGLGNPQSCDWEVPVRGRGQDEACAESGGAGGLGHWSRFDILPCRDGKARRVESGTFPLADGVPGRMGLLRGYGNAIVPQVAEIFVRAWMDTKINE